MPPAKKSDPGLDAPQRAFAAWAVAVGDPGANVLAYPGVQLAGAAPSDRAQRAARVLLADRGASKADLNALALALDAFVPSARPRARRRASKRAA